MEMSVSKPLKEESAELHEELVAATKAGGKVSEATRVIAETLHPPFAKEEEYALPPLGLLMMMAEGGTPSDIPAVIAMTDRLKKDLVHMLHEHRAIVTELHKLMEAAKIEKKPEYAHFIEKLKLQAQTEEESVWKKLGVEL